MRGQPKREWWVSDEFKKLLDDGRCVVYVSRVGGQIHAIGFHGKAQRPDFNYIFRSDEQLDRHVIAYAATWRRAAEHREQAARERREAGNPYAVGQILVRSWGYEQTNVNFYEVIATTAKTITVREISGDYTETGYMSGHTSACPGAYVGEAVRLTLGTRGSNRLHLSVWDGRPHYCSSYA